MKKQEFVYFVRGKESGWIKVGCSISPETRSKQLGCGEKVELLFYFPASYEIEQMLHAAFSGLSSPRGTEWFKNEGVVAQCIASGLYSKLQTEKRKKR